MVRPAPSRVPTILVAAGAAVTVVLGALSAAIPALLAGLAALPFVLLVPVVPIAIAVLADGVALPLLLSGRGTAQVNVIVLGAVLLGVVVPLLRRRVDAATAWMILMLGAAVSGGIVIAIVEFPLAQTLSGLRYVLVPALVAVLASTLTARTMRMLLRVVTVTMTLSAIAAAVETAIGSDRLLTLTGLAYGVSIRNFGEALRAPGLFATNFHLGAFAGVMAAVALLWWGTLPGADRDLGWRAVALVTSVASLLLSTYRTGVLLLVVAIVAAVVLGGGAVRAWAKVVVVVVGLGVAVGFQIAGLANTSSILERIGIWGRLLAGPPALLGNGIGAVGAASGAQGSARQIFTDNYFISLWLQFGVLGIVVVGIFVAIAARLLMLGRRGNRAAALAACLWIGVLVAFVFVEFWEYTSAMSLVTAVVAFSTRVPRSERILRSLRRVHRAGA